MWTTELGCGPPHRRMPCSASIATRRVNTVVTFQVNKFQAQRCSHGFLFLKSNKRRRHQGNRTDSVRQELKRILTGRRKVTCQRRGLKRSGHIKTHSSSFIPTTERLSPFSESPECHWVRQLGDFLRAFVPRLEASEMKSDQACASSQQHRINRWQLTIKTPHSQHIRCDNKQTLRHH